MSQRAWEAAMGMRTYRGSPAEAEDRAAGIKVGGLCYWQAEGCPPALINRVELDDDGEPLYHLSFPWTDDKPVIAMREEISPHLL